MNLETIAELHKPQLISIARRNRKRVGMSGLGGLLDSLNLTTLGSKALDVLGSSVAKAPSMYVSPDDPRYRAQPPQNVYMVQPAPAANTPVMAPMAKSSGIGFNIDQKTLYLLAGGVLLFMVASRR